MPLAQTSFHPSDSSSRGRLPWEAVAIKDHHSLVGGSNEGEWASARDHQTFWYRDSPRVWRARLAFTAAAMYCRGLASIKFLIVAWNSFFVVCWWRLGKIAHRCHGRRKFLLFNMAQEAIEVFRCDHERKSFRRMRSAAHYKPIKDVDFCLALTVWRWCVEVSVVIVVLLYIA